MSSKYNIEALIDLIKSEKPIVIPYRNIKVKEKEIQEIGNKQWKANQGIVVSEKGVS
jgi:hypothetical protein